MTLNGLSDSDRMIVFQAMKSILNDTWIDDEEFQTRLGLSRSELEGILAAWPSISQLDADTWLAISNSLNEICYGINISQAVWNAKFGFSKREVEQVYEKMTLQAS